MANPVTTVRQTPGGIQLKEGFPVKVSFARDPDFEMAEKSVKPPMVNGGEAIDITTQFNNLLRTKYPRTLHELGPISGRSAYNPKAFASARSNLVNQNGSVTCRWADGSTLDLFAFLRVFDPQEMSEGAQPEAAYEIEISNYDNATNAEVGPVYTDVAGT